LATIPGALPPDPRAPRPRTQRRGDRGFGFIQTEDGSDIFFHRSQVEGDAFDTLREGQAVTYEKGMDPRRGKPQAEKITPA
jgi:CspA family cold shock protein